MRAGAFVGIGPVIAAAIVATDRRIHRQLESAGATTAERAIVFTTGSPLIRWRLRRLSRAGAVQVEAGGRHYLDPVGWRQYRRQRRVRALSVLGVVLMAVGYLWWRGRFN